VRRAQLDAELARGADPWSRGDLMVRAAQLASLEARQNLASALRALVHLAERQRPASRSLSVRHRAVSEQREPLLVLAARLAEPAPVRVSVVAEIAQLLLDPKSPVYVGGTPPQRLVEATTRALDVVAGDDLASA
jgi:hypothetical protein